MAEAGAAGYEILTSSRQSDRIFRVDVDSGLGRKPCALPAHLSQVLYIPEHSMLDFTLYDAQVQYHKAITTSPVGNEEIVGRPLMGSRLFKTRLNTMDTATVVHHGAPRYMVNLDVDSIKGGGEISATVQENPLTAEFNHDKSFRIDIIFPMMTDIFSLAVADTEGKTQNVAISTTYPLQPLRTSTGVIRFPYFAFSVDHDTESLHYEWQIHPFEHGTLRYTLFRTPSREPAEGAASSQQRLPLQQHEDADIVAVYHHIGRDASLFQPTSEGVLLLPAREEETSPLMEFVAVATLVGMLWRIRGMDIWQEPENGGHKKRSLVEKVFGVRKT
ncbi:hypothetical protein E4U54_006703 [Claviceps lovelessii]|nr:hypothetical protein E4U54_006703 [Claviceps lovelessii]